MQTVPFSTRTREIVFDSLSDGYGYAFDFGNPSGVKLLPPGVFSRLGSSSDLAQAQSADEQLQTAVALLRHNPIRETNARLTVWLHVINGCNFACHYCYIPHLNRFVDRRTLEKHSLRLQTIHPLLNNLLGYCKAEHLTELHINFAGGEPTLNLPLVEEFCREASACQSSVKLTFGMISNGSFDVDDLIPLIDRYNIRLSLSVDGYEDSHDRIRFELDGRAKRGSWKKLSENVKRLVDRGTIPYFLYTVTPSNYESIDDFANYAHSCRIGFRLSLVRTKVTVAREIQTRIANELLRFYDGLGETLDVSLPILRFAAFAEWNLYQKKYVPCSSCQKYFAIDAAGNVASCQMRMNHTYGNAVSQPFAEIVAGVRADPVNVTMSKASERTGVCVQCQFFHVCASGCPQHNLLATGLMDRPSPWCHVYGTVLPQYIRAAARQLQRVVVSRQ
jgi:uncharacterized protein